MSLEVISVQFNFFWKKLPKKIGRFEPKMKASNRTSPPSTIPHFYRKNLEKLQYLPHHSSDTGFKGTVANRGLPSLRRGTLENSNFSLLKIS